MGFIRDLVAARVDAALALEGLGSAPDLQTLLTGIKRFSETAPASDRIEMVNYMRSYLAGWDEAIGKLRAVPTPAPEERPGPFDVPESVHPFNPEDAFDEAPEHATALTG